MTIREYLEQNRLSTLIGLNKLVTEAPSEEPTMKDLVKLFDELSKELSIIYSKGFKDAVSLIEFCDVKFLKRKLPPKL